MEGAKTRLGFYGIACFVIGLGFGVGPRIFSSLTSPLSSYLTKALPGVLGVDAITTSVTVLLGFLTFGAILLGAFQLAWGSRDSIEGGKKTLYEPFNQWNYDAYCFCGCTKNCVIDSRYGQRQYE